MSTFRTSRDLPAPPHAVFAAFREPARLARWWGPEGFTNTFYTFEFRPGGAWRFTMHGPDGSDHPNESEFLEIVPDALVRIQHVNPPRFELAITLEPSGTGTRITWVGVLENREFAEKMRPFLETANEQNLDRLAREVGAGDLESACPFPQPGPVAARLLASTAIHSRSGPHDLRHC